MESITTSITTVVRLKKTLHSPVQYLTLVVQQITAIVIAKLPKAILFLIFKLPFVKKKKKPA
jgi:hypothetical protein